MLGVRARWNGIPREQYPWTRQVSMMGEHELIQSEIMVTRRNEAAGWLRQTIERYTQQGVNWSRKYSLFGYPFVTACCGMEFMALNSPRYDLAQFGAEFPRFSPRQ